MTWAMICALYFEHITVLGAKCRVHDCDRVAHWNVAWPGQGTSPNCTDHRDRWAKIAEVMGFELQSTPRYVRDVEPVDDAAVRFANMELT